MTLATLSRKVDSTKLSEYLQEIHTYPRVRDAEEAELAQRIRTGEKDALDALVKSNLRFVVPLAMRHQHEGSSLSDLINAGNQGLVRAAQQFQATDGVSFISYAIGWIREAILQASRVDTPTAVAHSADADSASHVAILSSGSDRDGRTATKKELVLPALSRIEKATATPDSRAHQSLPRDNRTVPLPPAESLTADDRMLMEGIRRGDERSFADLLQRHWSPLVSYARRFTGQHQDEAEDIVQETFVRVWRQRTSWSGTGAVGAYLYRITRNLALNAQRDRKALHGREMQGAEEISARSSQCDPAEDLEHGAIRDEVEVAIAALPERRREVFILCRFHGLSHQEVAETLGISRQTVANHMSAALTDLRSALAHHLGR